MHNAQARYPAPPLGNNDIGQVELGALDQIEIAKGFGGDGGRHGGSERVVPPLEGYGAKSGAGVRLQRQQ